MFSMTEYKGNALAITDAQIAADWRLGILRGAARMLKNGRPANDKGGMPETGSDTEHVRGSFRNPATCEIVELCEVEETTEQNMVWDSQGDYPETDGLLYGKATCACGRLVQQNFKLTVYPGELLKRVANA